MSFTISKTVDTRVLYPDFGSYRSGELETLSLTYTAIRLLSLSTDESTSESIASVMFSVSCDKFNSDGVVNFSFTVSGSIDVLSQAEELLKSVIEKT